ncbi:D-isomer specific 2-hydroxyacid dehydrogenase family protein [Flavobacterium sp. 5]|uniref:NAD(P)-dependent oxidoreductase n=1 Tax=Flavobacterium sp. 5 TaxID=2035199 RepID=UPI000C2C1041|nr:2-hydroxyacid dehydrogenase [Flavobacterium sp. 5]PKB17469.1 D-3-phosphoglycerate dehydrogenase [Flavobacterium sp. 5]
MKIGKMKIVVVESQNFSEEALRSLSEIGDIKLSDVHDKAQLINNIKDAEVLFVRLRFYIDKEIIDACSGLKFILTATTGLDHIDVDYFERNGGRVVSLKGEYEFLKSIPSTAEHTWGLLLSSMRNIPNAFDDVKDGYWRRDLFKGNNLKGKKIGLLGLGRVGIQVAKYGEAFDMEIGFYDIENKINSYKKFDIPSELFAWADIVSIHIPLNQENIHFVDKRLLDQLNPNSILINTARGAVIDEIYLCNLIEIRRIKGYATDVLEEELNIDIGKNKLVELSKKGFSIIITPHIAGATFESMDMTELFIVEKFYKELNKSKNK